MTAPTVLTDVERDTLAAALNTTNHRISYHVQAGGPLASAVEQIIAERVHEADEALTQAVGMANDLAAEISRVYDWCDDQDRLSKGESPTTRAIRGLLGQTVPA